VISSPRSARAAVVAIAALAWGACLGDDPVEADVEFEVIEEADFDSALGIDLGAMIRLESGVYIEDLEVGEGADEVGWGDWVEMTYAGWLRSGAQYLPTDTIEFQIGGAVVPSGVHVGMIGQRLGGVRRMIVPPEHGYGAAAYQNVPAGSILIFQVELLEVSGG